MGTNFTERYIIDDCNTEQIAKKTLVKIKELSKTLPIQPDPIHFSLIYETILKNDAEFVAEINALIHSKNYDHNSAQILFTNLWAKIIQRHIPYEEFSSFLDDLLGEINNWVVSSEKNYAVLAKHIKTTEKESCAVKALLHIKNKIIPHLKISQDESVELQNNVEQITSEVSTLKKELNKVTILARTDELTGLSNRRGFNEFLAEVLASPDISSMPSVSLIAFDIDFFKNINDEFGHTIGDSVLKFLAKIFRDETKGRDLIARIGGEEFILVLKKTNVYSARLLAESIRKKVEDSKLHIKRTSQIIKLTISAGVAIYRIGESADDFIDRADKALYLSKKTGRNKTCTEDDLLS